MLWLKAFHIIFVVCWFAGLFYLPRIFVYYAASEQQAVREFMSRARGAGVTVTPSEDVVGDESHAPEDETSREPAEEQRAHTMLLRRAAARFA